ncbi:hypothetical protein L873DRAFT_1793359 [Choiromyces venosus 120613-1]|uniref:Uncharacterized protein n=1 Tax=Choiromyces venosus 120613-1 TaxID=1336337 RepID=A0A3N4J6Y0_9PEZI|nr:hypothetical protein L873DRAFT_1793359 [Choiromyces venosus 120613-1]
MLEGRTFHLAKSESRIQWYLVFVPKAPEVLDLDHLNNVITNGMAKSPLKQRHAEILADYLIELFLRSTRLAGAGVERSWSLRNNPDLESRGSRVTLCASQWLAFQEELFNSWERDMLSDDLADTFWKDHIPCLHAYDYGQDVELLTDDPDIDFDTHLVRELARMYNIDNAATFSCAVAANITGVDDVGAAYAILGDRETIEKEYRHSMGGYSFYPLGLSPRAGNFQAQHAPYEIDDRLWAHLLETSSNRNGGNQVLFPGPFQGYSMIKQVIRHSPKVFLPRKHFWEAGLGLQRNLASTKALTVQKRISAQLRNGSPTDRARWLIAREVDQRAAGIATNKFGYRFEQIINVRVDQLACENRHLDYVIAVSVAPYVHWWHENIRVWQKWLISFEPQRSDQIFPGVLLAFGNMFDSVLTEIYEESRRIGFASLDVGKVECVAHLEMLASYTFTGEIRICPTRLWKHLGISHSISNHGFPYIDPKKLSLVSGLVEVHGWPQTAGKDSLPELTYIYALKFHYGPKLAKAHHYWALFTLFAPGRIHAVDDLYSTIHSILESLMIPETQEWVQTNLVRASQQLRDQNLKRYKAQSSSCVRTSLELESVILREFHEREEQLSDFGSAKDPFRRGRLSTLVKQCIGVKETKGETEFWPIREYTARLYETLSTLDLRDPGKNSMSFADKNATWHVCIAVALQNIPSHLKPLDGGACATSIASSLTALGVEEIPGTYRGKLSYRKTTHIRKVWDLESRQRRVAWKPRRHEDLLDPTTLSARNGIFEERIENPPPAALHFKFQTPFSELPKMIEEGCNGLMRDYQTSTTIIATQIQATLDVLDLQDPIVQLALILTSVLSIPTPLPCCPRVSGRSKFEDHAKRGREKDRWCAVLFLKMMWFRYPRLAETEFVKCLNEKQGHQKISIAFLLEIGWVRLRASVRRQFPRPNDVKLVEIEILRERYHQYWGLIRVNPQGLLERIFHGEKEWVDRVVAALD